VPPVVKGGVTGLRRREAEMWKVKRFFCLHFILFSSRDTSKDLLSKNQKVGASLKMFSGGYMKHR
jgi:hypothetical protein